MARAINEWAKQAAAEDVQPMQDTAIQGVAEMRQKEHAMNVLAGNALGGMAAGTVGRADERTSNSIDEQWLLRTRAALAERDAALAERDSYRKAMNLYFDTLQSIRAALAERSL